MQHVSNSSKAVGMPLTLQVKMTFKGRSYLYSEILDKITQGVNNLKNLSYDHNYQYRQNITLTMIADPQICRVSHVEKYYTPFGFRINRIAKFTINDFFIVKEVSEVSFCHKRRS